MGLLFQQMQMIGLDEDNSDLYLSQIRYPKKFDPNFHQAMSEIEDDSKDPGTILHQIQAGYMLGDRLLRPALVSVSKNKVHKEQENKDKKGDK